jgi:hypothetical protein
MPPSMQSAQPPSQIVLAAKAYLSRQWSILPLRPREKRPIIQWEPLQSARPSQAELILWFERWPDANIGIITGEISNLIVIDIDPDHGGDASLERLERRFQPLPTTVEAKSGGGGRHLYFTHPGGIIRNRAAIAQGIDLRGDGGYVVAPPSIHPNGARYTWVLGRSPEDIALAPLPRWLTTATSALRPKRTLDDWHQLVREGVPEGQRNSTIASLTGHLLWHGIDPQVALELLLAWNRTRCRPPLDDAEVARVVQSIVHLHGKDY